MTENEAIKMLKAKLTCMKLEALSCIEKGCDKDCECCEYNYAQGNMGEQKEALDIAIQSLEEIQQYRAIGTVEQVKYLISSYNDMIHDFGDNMTALEEYQEIGTVEECREAVEKMKPKKVSVHVNDEDVRVGHVIFRKGVKTYKCQCGKFVTMSQIYCSDCGQRLLWEE